MVAVAARVEDHYRGPVSQLRVLQPRRVEAAKARWEGIDVLEV